MYKWSVAPFFVFSTNILTLRGGSVLQRFFVNNKVVRLQRNKKHISNECYTLHGPADWFEVYRTQTRKKPVQMYQKLKA